MSKRRQAEIQVERPLEEWFAYGPISHVGKRGESKIFTRCKGEFLIEKADYDDDAVIAAAPCRQCEGYEEVS